MGEAEHRTGDSQPVGDSLDDIDVRQGAALGHDFANPAGRHAAECGDA
ncbi:hypothetical protein ACWC5C_33955 [Streptomyces sp. NPDC001700]